MASTINDIISAVKSTVQQRSGSATNIVICLVTVGSEELFSFASFCCPCPQDVSYLKEVSWGNLFYGWAFIVIPAIALFFLGCGMNSKTWKLMTGCWNRNKDASSGCAAGCIVLAEIFLQALVAPMAWISVALLDGKYYACATTANPYQGSCDTDAIRSIKSLPASLEFESNRRDSQIYGWCVLTAILILGSTCYTIYRCCSPLTYYHRKYALWYREEESKAFEKIAKDQILEKVENGTVPRFLHEERKKFHWDKISTVFQFRRIRNGFALYSQLDEWNEENQDSKPLISKNETDRRLLEDASSLDPHVHTTKTNSIRGLASPSTSD